MKRILIIGDYYPHISFNSVLNKLIAERLNREGYKLILLSSAWCCIRQNELVGDVYSLSENFPFEKRFYLDPIQVSCSGGDLLQSYLGLACKILKNYTIDLILYADTLENSLLVELIKNRFGIETRLIVNDFSIYKCLDNYTFPYLFGNLKNYSTIYSYLPNQKLLQDFFQVPKDKLKDVNDILKKWNVLNIDSENCKKLCVLTLCLDNEKLNTIKETLGNITSNFKVLWVTIKNNTFDLFNNEEVMTIDRFLDLKLTNTVVAFENELLDHEKVSFSEISIAQICGYSCLLSMSNIRYLSQFYDVQYFKVNEEFGILKCLNSKEEVYL